MERTLTYCTLHVASLLSLLRMCVSVPPVEGLHFHLVSDYLVCCTIAQICLFISIFNLQLLHFANALTQLRTIIRQDRIHVSGDQRCASASGGVGGKDADADNMAKIFFHVCESGFVINITFLDPTRFGGYAVRKVWVNLYQKHTRGKKGSKRPSYSARQMVEISRYDVNFSSAAFTRNEYCKNRVREGPNEGRAGSAVACRRLWNPTSTILGSHIIDM